MQAATRSSRRTLRTLSRSAAVVITISPSAYSNQSGVNCGEPSRFTVASLIR